MKFSSIILAVVFLFQSMGLKPYDLIKLDELIEHAEFHNQEYGDNIFVFLSKHYGSLKSEHNKAHQEEKSDHEQLPFQQNIYANGLAVLSLVTTQKLSLNIPEFLDYKPHMFFYQESFSSIHSENILQPPRFI